MLTEGSSALLEADGLIFGYSVGHEILSDLTISLHPGEISVLSGANGSGKSTLLKVLAGLIVPSSGRINVNTRRGQGYFSFPSKPLRSFGRRHSVEQSARMGIAFLGQNSRNLKRVSVQDQVELMVPGFSVSPLREILGKRRSSLIHGSNTTTSNLLEKLGLSQIADQAAGSLSLGQGKRLAFASILHSSTEVLLLDEPLSGLDADSRRVVLSALQAKVTQTNATALIVEHFSSAGSLRELATRFLELRDGKVLETSGRGLGGAKYGWSLPLLLNQIFNGWAESDREFPLEAKIVHFRAPGAVSNVEALRATMRLQQGESSRTAEVSLSVRPGEVAILFAPNGWGKTTLLDGITGLQDRVPVQASLHSRDLTSLKTWERAKAGLGSIRANNLTAAGLSLGEIASLAGVERLELPDEIGSVRSGTLSGGQLRFGMLCVALATTHHVLLADECLNDLDLSHATDALTRIRDWVGAGSRNRAAVLAFPSQDGKSMTC